MGPRTNFPAMTAAQVYATPNVTQFHAPAVAGQNFLAGEASQHWYGHANIGALVHAVTTGPNSDYTIVTNAILFNQPDVKINQNELAANSALWGMAATTPAWPAAPAPSPPFLGFLCSQDYIANSFLAQAERHEGTQTQTILTRGPSVSTQ